MKAACASVIGILAYLLSACVTGDEITSYVIEPVGSISFSIYRLNLTSDKTGEKAKEELANYIRNLEKQSSDHFTKLAKANAKEINVTILRKASPASVLITGRFASLNDFAAYSSEEDDDSSLVCTPTSRERTRGILCELTRKPSKEKFRPETFRPRADSFEDVRVSLTKGIFTKAQGFTLSDSKRSALLDTDTLLKVWNSQIASIPLSLEWQIPEAP
jgi:hypothetical protein